MTKHQESVQVIEEVPHKHDKVIKSFYVKLYRKYNINHIFF